MIGRSPFRAAWRALLPLLPIAGAGCSGGDTISPAEDSEGVRATATLASVIARDPQISQTARLLSRTGMAQVLDGAGSYTMLVPVNDASESGRLRTISSGPSAGSTQAMAVLRHHILPGYITIADIRAALAGDADGTTLMRTLDGGYVRFAKSGKAITATDQSGARTRLSGTQILAANGVAITLDRPLRPPLSDDQ